VESKRALNGRDHRSLRIAAFTLVVAFVLLAAAASFGAVPKKLAFPPIEFKMPKIDTLVFANGLRGYLLEDHEIPVVNIVIKFKTGYPPEDKTGLNEVAGWAIRNGGSRSYSKEALDDELEFMGASIESYSGPVIGQISANFLTKDTDRVLGMFSDLITNPAFDPAKIDLQKKSMIEDIRRKADDPNRLGHREFSKLIYRNHPAGREATVKTVTNIGREDVVGFHNGYVRPNNAVVGISGDMTRQEALAKINACLAGWQRGGETPVFPDMKYEAVPTVNYIYKDLNQAYIYVGHMGMNGANSDVPLANIMNFVLGGGSFTSWIIKRVRSDEGLAYDAGSSFGANPWGYGLFTASCQTRTDAAMRALGIMIEQIEKMRNEGPSEGEVKTAKDSYINRQVFDYESSSGIIDRLVWYDIVGLPLDTLEREFKAYQSATLGDVNRVAKQYLHPEGLTILVIGNQNLFDRPLSDFGKVNAIEIKEEEVPVE
jgi:predicted Zn-dependent peptidase